MPATHETDRPTAKQTSRLFPLLFIAAAAAGVAAASNLFGSGDRSPQNHAIHDPDRPQPPVVDPGPAGPPAPAPSDAIVLFDGSGLDEWRAPDGSAAGWRVIDGKLQVVPRAGDIHTARLFGDVQLHVEFKTYVDSPGEDQRRSNSGVFFGPYEVQVLDSYRNETYPDGMVASIYGQYPPLVNAARPPGEWQTFDIVFRAPVFGETGEVLQPARMTVFHNGVLVQDNEELIGPTSHGERKPYRAHGPLPIRLQDHRDDPIHFRNIWVREL
jgi:hypothetical protein